MIQAAETELLTHDLAVDDLLRQIDTAWVDDEFSAIIAANWPAEPPEPPPAAGPANAEPRLPRSSGALGPRGRLTNTTVSPSVAWRQRSPPMVTRATATL
jgi:hypothetical protein